MTEGKGFSQNDKLGTTLHPFLSRTKTFITHEEVYENGISYEELVALIRKLPTEYWLRVASMGEIFVEHYGSEVKFQGVLFRFLCPQNLLETKVPAYGDRERFLFHKVQFLALMRLALLCEFKPLPITVSDEERKDITTRCLVGISSLIYKVGPQPREESFEVNDLMNKLTFDSRRKLTPSEKGFLLTMLQLYHNHLNENIGHAAGRYKDMLLDIPDEAEFKPQGTSRDLLSRVILEKMRMSLSEYAALTFGLISRYFSPEGIFGEHFHFPVNKDVIFSKSSLDMEIVSRYLQAISVSQSEFAEEQKARGAYPGLINDFRSLMLKPLVHLDSGNEYYPVGLTYLERLLDSALIWVVTGGDYRDDLRNYWGQTFEYYCHKICQRIELNSRVKPKYFRKRTYGPDHKQRESCDAILVYGDTAVMMEFKIKSLKLFDTVITGDFDSLVEDIKTAFVRNTDGEKAVSQIDATIRAMRTGDLVLPGINPHRISRYFPVVVTLHPWPLGPFVYEFLRMTIAKAGLLRHLHVSPVEIWSAEDLESVEAIVTSNTMGPVDLPSLLRAKLLSQHSNLAMSTFLWDKYASNFPRNTYLQSRSDEMFEIVISTLSLKR